MNVLITGGSGFIGSKLHKILKKNNKVFIYDIIKPSFNSKYIKGNLNNISSINKILIKHKINCIIHLAASIGVKFTELNPSNVIDINIHKMKNLLDAVKGTRVKKFLFTSSSEVYGETIKTGVTENDDNLHPKSIYAHSKIVGESLIKTYSKYLGFSYIICRLFSVCGYGQRNSFVISKFINDAHTKKKIFVYGDGNQTRCFCHVDDATKAMTDLLKSKHINQTFNIGNNYEPITMSELAKKVSKKFKNKITIKKTPFSKSERTKIREIYYRKPNMDKLRKTIKFQPKFSIDTIIDEFFDQ
jgi:UDP-glucose 4-epimerase